MRRVKNLLKLLRPFTLLAPAMGAVCFGLMGIKDAGLNVVDSLPALFLSGFILAMANATSNIFNQIYDADIDKKHPEKKKRPIASGLVSKDEAMSFALVIMLITIALALILFTPAYGLSLTVIMLCCWLYNCPPFRLKKRLILSNLGISVPRGGLGITCAYSAFADPFNTVMYVAMIYFALYVFGANTLKDFADAKYDKLAGVKNFVTVWGIEKASYLVTAFTFIPFYWLLMSSYIIEISWISFLPLLFSVAITYLLLTKSKKEGIEGNSVLWMLFYIQMSTMMLLFTLPRIL